MTWKPYMVKPAKKERPPRPGVIRSPANPGEVFTGYIGNFPASDIEERSARSLDAKQESFKFRTQIIPSDPPMIISGEQGRNQLGAAEIDFFIEPFGLPTAINIDGAFAHKTAEQKENDKKKDTEIIKTMQQIGGIYFRIPGHFLQDQMQSDQTWSEVLAGRTSFGSDS